MHPRDTPQGRTALILASGYKYGPGDEFVKLLLANEGGLKTVNRNDEHVCTNMTNMYPWHTHNELCGAMGRFVTLTRNPVRSFQGWTPLYHSVSQNDGRTNVTKLLLDAGAGVDVCDIYVSRQDRTQQLRD